MFSQFLLFVITLLLFSIFWELTKINSHFKRAFPPQKQKETAPPTT